MSTAKKSNAHKRIIIIAVFGLIIFSVTMMYFGNVSKKEEEKNKMLKVVIATTEIKEGTITTAEMFELKKVPQQYVARGSLTQLEQVVGKVAAYPIIPGEQVNHLKFKQRSAKLGLQYVIPKGKRAVSVEVDKTGTIASLVNVGDRVDVVCLIREQTTARAITILQDVEIYAIDQKTEKNEKVEEKKKSGLSTREQVVTFALSLSEAEKLIAASDAGTIKLVLRPHEDDSTQFTRGKTKWSLYPPAPQTQRIQIIKGTEITSEEVAQKKGPAL